jgi:hypothetical protein
MEPVRTGVMVIETSGNPPKAFRIWSADLMGCPICGLQVLERFGGEPVIESHQAGFTKALMGVTREKRYVMHSPEALAMRVTHETKIVKKARSHAN